MLLTNQNDSVMPAFDTIRPYAKAAINRKLIV